MDRPRRGSGGDGGGHPGAAPLIESLLAHLAGLPAALIYALLGLLAALENIFPPVPADTAVALGAFLSHRGLTSPWLVFGVTICANTASAALVYLLARRLGPRFAGTRWGKRLLPGEALLAIERKYLRWGLPAIFLCRMIPGIRAIVPPFTGLIGLPPRRALAPITIASAIWYGFVTIAGTILGAEWETMVALIAHVNRALTIGAIAALVVAGTWFFARRRTREAAGAVADRVLERVLPEDRPR